MKTLLEFIRLFHSLDGGEGGGGGDGGQGGGGDGGQQQQAAFDIRQHVDDAGAFKPDWWKGAGVPETVGKKFTRPEALARSYVTLEKQIGAKGLIVPGANATPAERDAFQIALGRPAKAEEYGLVKPATIKVGDKDVPVPDTVWNPDRAKAWEKTLFEMGVPKDVAQKIMLKATEESVTGLEAIAHLQRSTAEQAGAALKKEFGAEYDANMAAAKLAASKFGGDALVNHPALGNDPVLIRALVAIAKATAERPGVGQRQQAGSDSVTPADAKVRAQQLTKEIGDKTRADRNWSRTPEAAALKAEKSRMFELANPA